MLEAMSVYFDGEKYAGLFLAGIGAAIIAAGLILFRTGWRSLAVTLILLALAEIALGVGLYLRTGPQVAQLEAKVGSPAFFDSEGPRMARVQRNFLVIEAVEMAIIIGATIIAVLWKGRTGVTGVALGLLIHASLLLAFDILAERRGAVYLDAIQKARILPAP